MQILVASLAPDRGSFEECLCMCMSVKVRIYVYMLCTSADVFTSMSTCLYVDMPIFQNVCMCACVYVCDFGVLDSHCGPATQAASPLSEGELRGHAYPEAAERHGGGVDRMERGVSNRSSFMDVSDDWLRHAQTPPFCWGREWNMWVSKCPM